VIDLAPFPPKLPYIGRRLRYSVAAIGHRQSGEASAELLLITRRLCLSQMWFAASAAAQERTPLLLGRSPRRPPPGLSVAGGAGSL